jgi:hypothetical protein
VVGDGLSGFWPFIKVTSELVEHEVSGVDRTILIGLAKARTPWLTAATSPERSLGGLHLDPAGVVAVDLTAWGPVTLVVLILAMSGRCENDGERRGLKSPPAKVALSVG